MENKNIANVFKAFCDEKRIRILKFLQDDEKCACHIIEYMDMGQSVVSYHMKILLESNMIVSRQEGKWIYYSLNKEGASQAILLIDKIMKI